ncbi:MAG: NblA/ycf18 family protein [Verrucomicrobia bacterium]|nr:NblA/ycf18 family protein [Leptolyngbya sp. ES-bin-22]
MDQVTELTLEQSFSLRRFTDQVEQMSHEQAQAFLIEQYRQMLLRETLYKDLLKHEWQLDSGFASLQNS